MSTLSKRATPLQQRLLRIVEGAVKNALHAHPGVRVPSTFASSVAKRAAGTLSAELAGMLAATPMPSERADAGSFHPQSQPDAQLRKRPQQREAAEGPCRLPPRFAHSDIPSMEGEV